MALTDYDFYKNQFYGDTIAEDEFAKYEAMSEDRVHALTSDRLAYGLPSDERSGVKVQKAVCALADLLYLINQEALSQATVTDENGNTHRAVSSITAGSESISYSTTASTEISKAVADTAFKESLIASTVIPYLANVADDKGVNLLYRGL